MLHLILFQFEASIPLSGGDSTSTHFFETSTDSFMALFQSLVMPPTHLGEAPTATPVGEAMIQPFRCYIDKKLGEIELGLLVQELVGLYLILHLHHFGYI